MYRLTCRHPVLGVPGVSSLSDSLGFQPRLFSYEPGAPRARKTPVRAGRVHPELDDALREACLLCGLPEHGRGLTGKELAAATTTPPHLVRLLDRPHLCRRPGVRHLSRTRTALGPSAFASCCLVAGSERILGRHSTAELAAASYNRFVAANGLGWDFHPADEILCPEGREWVYYAPPTLFRSGSSPEVTTHLLRGHCHRDGVWDEEPLPEIFTQTSGGGKPAALEAYLTVEIRRRNPFFWAESLHLSNLRSFADAGVVFGFKPGEVGAFDTTPE